MAAQIRLARGTDAEQIAAIYGPIVRDTVVSFEVEPPTPAEMARRIVETLVRWPWLVCARDAEVLGYAYASQHHARAAYRWSADVSVYIHAAARRHGVGRAAYTSLLALLTLQGFYNAYAGITLPNPASVGLHEAMSFTSVGVYRAVGHKLGGWHDVGWWQLSLREHGTPAGPPLEVAAARASSGWERTLATGTELLRL